MARAKGDVAYETLMHAPGPLSEVARSSNNLFARFGAQIVLLLAGEARNLLAGPDDLVLARLSEIATNTSESARMEILDITTQPPFALGATLEHARQFVQQTRAQRQP